ncbi:disabled homolog 2-interacting protein-like isoform X2 [Clytia hemisphaerica]
MLFWGEKFVFEDLPPTESLTISLFRESDTKKKRNKDKHFFVGSSVIDLLSMETNIENEKWVSVFVPGISPKLQQKTLVNGKADKSEQPFIRAKFKYETTIVLPLASYQTLHEYVLKNYLLLVSTLEAGISLKIKDLLAQTLLKILQANNGAEEFLVSVIMNECYNTTDENLTFRGNSLATKSIDTYMKMIGKNYLQETLGSFIKCVYEAEEDTEVDPQKIASSNANLTNNQQYLKKLLEEVWKNITESVPALPKRLRNVFSMVRQRCEEKGLGLATKITSASLFLRFLCPAILSPSLFQLTQEYPGEKVARSLTLVAKTLQNLANFTRFGIKESYMEFLNEFVESQMPSMEAFLQSVSADLTKSKDRKISEAVGGENIDLSRALSILYHILQSEIPNLAKEESENLKDLKPILRHISDIHEASPKVDELRLSRPFATVASVVSKPLTTPLARDETPITPITPLSINTEEDEEKETSDCYHDTTLSFNEDFVSNSSASLSHRGKSPSRNLAKLNEGRGTIDRKKLQLSSRSTPDFNGIKDGKRSKSVDNNISRLHDTKGKLDKFMSPSHSQTQSPKHMKSDPALNSLKRRQLEQQQATSPTTPKSPIRKGGKDSVKDRISMFSNPTSPKPQSPHKVLVSPKPGLSGKAFFPSNKHSSVESRLKMTGTESPMSSTSSIPRATKQPSPAMTSKHNTLPKTNSNIPIPKSNNTPTSTPPGLRKPPHQLNKPAIREKPATVTKKPLAKSQSLVSSPKPELKQKPKSTASQSNLLSNSNQRPKLTLSNLRKEHHFDDSASPELLSYERSPKRNYSDREMFSDTASSAVGDDYSSVTSQSHFNTLSKHSREDDEEDDTVSWGSQLHVPLKENVHDNSNQNTPKRKPHHASTLEKPKSPKKNGYPVQRRHSELSPREYEKRNTLVAQSQEIAQIHTNGYRETLHEGFVEECKHSISSVEYSSCEYSSDSYYTSEDDMDFGELIEGDRMEDVMSEHKRKMNGDSTPRYDRNGSVSSSSKMSQRTIENDRKNDVNYLRKKLRESEDQLQKTQTDLKNKTVQFEETVIHLKEKLVDADNKMKKQRIETDGQMKNVISRLLNVESELRNEHSEMEAVIAGKQKLIDIQERRIKSLESSNLRLVNALTHIKNKYSTEDQKGLKADLDEQGIDLDDLDQKPQEL